MAWGRQPRFSPGARLGSPLEGILCARVRARGLQESREFLVPVGRVPRPGGFPEPECSRDFPRQSTSLPRAVSPLFKFVPFYAPRVLSPPWLQREKARFRYETKIQSCPIFAAYLSARRFCAVPVNKHS